MEKRIRGALDRLSSMCYVNHTCRFCGGDEYGLDDEGEEGGMYHNSDCPWLAVEAECQRTEFAAKALSQIIETEGDDAGIIYMSHESRTKVVDGLSVYEHDYFSPLGDALMAVYKLLAGETSEPIDFWHPPKDWRPFFPPEMLERCAAHLKERRQAGMEPFFATVAWQWGGNRLWFLDRKHLGECYQE